MKMTKFKKVLAVLLASMMLLGVVSCTKNDAVPAESSGVAIPSDANTAPTIDLSGYSFDTNYGSQLIGYLDRQYYFEGEAIPVDESNFYIIDAFIELTNYATYGIYPMTSEGYIDLSAVPSTTDEDVTYANYGEFLLEYAERMLESTYVIKSMAEAEGLALSDETIAEIDATVEAIEANSATPAGLTMDEYLKLWYGDSCSTESFRNIVTNYKIADLYTIEYIENYEFSDDEIMVPNVRYALITAAEGSADEDIEAAEAAANEILEASTDLDQLEVQCALAYTNGTVYETNTMAVEEGLTVEAFDTWCFDESREVGDIDVIYAPEYGYFVVGYLGTTEVATESQDSIAVAALGDYVTSLIEAGEYEFYSNDPVTVAAPVPTEEPVPTEDFQTLLMNAEELDAANRKKDPKEIVMIVFAAIGGAALLTGIFASIYYVVSKKKTSDNDIKEASKAKENKSSDKDIE